VYTSFEQKLKRHLITIRSGGVFVLVHDLKSSTFAIYLFLLKTLFFCLNKLLRELHITLLLVPKRFFVVIFKR